MPEKPVCRLSNLYLPNSRLLYQLQTQNLCFAWLIGFLTSLLPVFLSQLSPSPMIATPSSWLLMAKTLELFSTTFIPISPLSGNHLGPTFKYMRDLSPSQTCYSNLLLPCSEPPALACYYLAHLHSLYSTQSDHFQIKVKSWYFFVQTPVVRVSLRMKARVRMRADKAIVALFPHPSPSCSPH